jgi:uncharacterized membrane protein (UPF0127 family)
MTGPLNLTFSDADGNVTEIVTILPPGGTQPKYTHTDVDGDRLLITTATFDDGARGVMFRTDTSGSAVPLAEMPALLAKVQVIMAAMKGDDEVASEVPHIHPHDQPETD